MKKRAISLAVMIMAVSVAFGTTGCMNSGNTNATAPTATPIATAPPTQAPTKPTQAPTQAVTQAPAQAPTQAPTQAATFAAEVSTGGINSTEPTTMAGVLDATGATGATTTTTAAPLAPDANGNYVLSGIVTGYGANTVVIRYGDGNEYEFNYTQTNVTYENLYDGAYVVVVADGDPSGAGVPNATSLVIG